MRFLCKATIRLFAMGRITAHRTSPSYPMDMANIRPYAAFGFTKEGSTLSTVAGVIMEFLSATALLIYRLSFNRLNESTGKIDNAWRIMTAHTLSKTSPDDKLPSDATMKLIDALLAVPEKSLIKAARLGVETETQRAAPG